MNVKGVLLFLLSLTICKAQNFWEKTNFPTDSTSLSSVYSLITNSSDDILAGTFAKGVYKSTNQGLSWSESGLSNQWVKSMAKDNAGKIYAASIGSQSGTGIFKSTDGGSGWGKIWDATTGMNCVYTDSDGSVYVGLNYSPEQNGIFKLTGGSGSWNNILNKQNNIYAITKLTSGRILAASYGLIYFSDNNGTTWDSTSTGLVNSTPSAFVVNNSGEIYLSTLGYGIYKSTDNGLAWTNKTGAGPDYSCLISDGNGTMYAGTQGYWVYKSVDGETWDLVKTGMGDDKYVLSLMVSDAGYLFAGHDYYGIYRSAEKVITDVKEETNIILSDFALEQNYPNPFNPTTTIKYSVPFASHIKLNVFNLLGQEVSVLVNEQKSAGNHEVKFNAENLASGIYLYKLQAGDFISVKKLTLLK